MSTNNNKKNKFKFALLFGSGFLACLIIIYLVIIYPGRTPSVSKADEPYVPISQPIDPTLIIATEDSTDNTDGDSSANDNTEETSPENSNSSSGFYGFTTGGNIYTELMNEDEAEELAQIFETDFDSFFDGDSFVPYWDEYAMEEAEETPILPSEVDQMIADMSAEEEEQREFQELCREYDATFEYNRDNHIMEQRTFKKDGFISFNYWYYTPSPEETDPMPVIVYLHGIDGKGSDLKREIQIESIAQYIYKGYMYPNAIIISPQLPANEKSWSYLSDSIVECLKDLVTRGIANDRKISITGISLGGIGVFQILDKYQHFFSCAVPISGSTNVDKSAKLTDIPIRIYQGETDYAMGTTVYAADKKIRANGGDCELFKIMNKGHELRYLYYDKEYRILEWMILQTKPDNW